MGRAAVVWGVAAHDAAAHGVAVRVAAVASVHRAARSDPDAGAPDVEALGVAGGGDRPEVLCDDDPDRDALDRDAPVHDGEDRAGRGGEVCACRLRSERLSEPARRV